MGNMVSWWRAEDSCCSSSLPHIPEELIKSEILIRLPVNSIIRFRCVCKSWKHLLSGGDPDFVQSHLTHYSMNLLNYGGSLIARSFPLFNPNNIHPLNSRFVDLGGSVNGLVCVYTHNYFNRSIDSVGLWNPATNNYKDIPVPPSNHNNMDMGRFSFGIGFDPVANDYKVMYVTRNHRSQLVAHVYSCNSDSWGINCVTSTFVAQGTHFSCPTVVHTCPYWSHHYIPHFYITYFDVRHDIFSFLPGITIDIYNYIKQQTVLVNLRESLALLLTDIVPHTTSRSVDVYFFDEKCHLWTKNYTIGSITLPKYLALLHCFRNGDLLFKCAKYIKLVAINPQTHAINRFASGMYRYDSSRFNLVFSYAFDYIQTLVSVKGMSPLQVKKVATDILIIEKSF